MAENLKGYRIPKRFIITMMAALATCVQYTIRSNLSVTIVAMVNTTELSDHSTNSFESILNITGPTMVEPKLIGCPMPEKYQNLNDKVVKHISKGPKLAYSESTQGFLLGAFFYGYILIHVVAGQIAGRFGAKKTIFLSLLFSSIFTILTPFSTRFDAIFVITLRVLTGMAQGVLSPSIYTLFVHWVPESEKSRAISMFTIGGYIGSVITMPLCGYLSEHGNFFGLVEGWPLVFYVLGLVGAISTAVWCFFVYDSPAKHPNVSYEEMLEIFGQQDVVKEKINTISCKLEGVKNGEKPKHIKLGSNVPWLKLLSSKDVWVVAIAKFCTSWSILLLMNKLPTYLDRILHIPIQKNALINSLIYISLCIAAYIFGYLSDLTIRKNWMTKLNSRKFFESISLFGGGFCLLAIPVFSCNENVTCGLVILSAVTYAAISGGDNVIVCDLTPEYSASVYGITNAIASIPGFLAPILVGILLNGSKESIENWNIIFIGSGLIACFGGVIFLFFASVEPMDLDNHKLKSKLSTKSTKPIKNSSA